MNTAITPQTQNQDWEAILPTIRNMYAKGATDPEFRIFCETARALGLNPILKQIWCVKNLNRPDLPAQIYTSRDGLIDIAHRSGQFDGIESGTRTNENGEMVGYCRIWRKDMTHPFYVEVLRSEYDTKRNLWADHPATMLTKVAMVHALRQAFRICGVYTPEEMGRQGEEQTLIHEAPPSQPPQATPAAPPTATIRSPPKVLPNGACTKPAEDPEQFRGHLNDWEHCFECGAKIDPTREGMVSKRDHGRYLCLKHLKLANQQAEANAKQAAPKLAAPAKEAIQTATPAKTPASTIKPDPHAGKGVLPPCTEVCQTCGEKLTGNDVLQSRLNQKPNLCPECLKQAILIDREAAKRRGTA